MNKKKLKQILFDYKRNKKHTEQLRDIAYGISSVDYTKPITQGGELSDTAMKVHKLYSYKVFLELKYKVDAVERVIEQLDKREKCIFEAYFINKKTVTQIDREGYGASRPTAYKVINNIINKLEKELKIFD